MIRCSMVAFYDMDEMLGCIFGSVDVGILPTWCAHVLYVIEFVLAVGHDISMKMVGYKNEHNSSWVISKAALVVAPGWQACAQTKYSRRMTCIMQRAHRCKPQLNNHGC